MDASVRARALARVLALGFGSPRDVVAWVDTLIVEASTPHPSLIDASLAEAKPGELVAALESFAAASGNADVPAVWSAVLGHLSSWLLAHPDDGPRIARALYRMAVAGECPDRDAESKMYAFDDQYDLAIDAVYGVREQIDRELSAFLARYADPRPR